MKFEWKQVIFWFALFHFIGEPLQTFMYSGSTSGFVDASSFKSIMITISAFISHTLYALLAYTAMYYFYPSQKWVLLLLGLLASIILPIAFRGFIEQYLYDFLFGFTNYFGHTTWSYFRDNLYFTFKYMAVGIGYFLIRYSRIKENRSRMLELENQKMHLSVLRSQVNPHFLLNSLNNIYSLVYQKSEKSLEALDKLSDLLKYNLYSKQDNVELKEELDYLDKYVELQSIRYNYPIVVNKNIAANLENVQIPQLLLLPLLENAFKHGTLKDHPITLDIDHIKNRIVIKVANKVGNVEKDSTSGVGLENVKNRLTLFYQGNSTFKFLEEDGYFKVEITIPTL